MSPEPASLELIYQAVRDVKATVEKLDSRLSKDVARLESEQHRLERQMVRVEAQAAIRDELLTAIKQQMATLAPREELRLTYVSREDLAAASQSRFRFALPLLMGALIGAPGYINLLMDAL